jgi:hypothetical protein
MNINTSDPMLWVRAGAVLAILFGVVDLFFFHVLTPAADKGADLAFILSGLGTLGVNVAATSKGHLLAMHDKLSAARSDARKR